MKHSNSGYLSNNKITAKAVHFYFCKNNCKFLSDSLKTLFHAMYLISFIAMSFLSKLFFHYFTARTFKIALLSYHTPGSSHNVTLQRLVAWQSTQNDTYKFKAMQIHNSFDLVAVDVREYYFQMFSTSSFSVLSSLRVKA